MATSNSHARMAAPQDFEALERSRRHMLVAVIATSSLWLLPQILRDVLTDGLPRLLNVVLVVAGVIGALAYVAFMMRFHRFQTRVHGDPELRQRLDDERVIGLRKEAVYRGWVTLLIAVAVGVAVAPFADLPDQAVLLTLMLLGVNAPIIFFLALDRG